MNHHSAAGETAELVLQIVPRVMRTVAAELRRREGRIEPVHYGVLFALSQPAVFNLSELADHMSVSRPTMSNIVTRLVTLGWIERTRSAADRRVLLLRLTPAGHAELADVHQYMKSKFTQIFESFSETESVAMKAGLLLLRNAFGGADSIASGK